MSIVVSAPAMRKTVVVLGHSAAGVELPPAEEITGTIVVLAIGWPLTERQEAVLEAAQATARSARVVFDAQLVASPAAVSPLIEEDDRIVLDADPREARRIRRAMAGA